MAQDVPAPDLPPPDAARASSDEDLAGLSQDVPAPDLPPPDAARGPHEEDSACSLEEARCNGECVDLQTSSEHCGACNSPCGPGEACRDRECRVVVVAERGIVCPTGWIVCDGECFNPLNSESHCGNCGVACAPSESCRDGECRVVVVAERGIVCPTGWIECDGQCFNPQGDELHCGACETACPSGYTCMAGVCCDPAGCPVGTANCVGQSCVDVLRSESHCGDCDTLCDSSEYCRNGVCEVRGDEEEEDCRSDWLLCGGVVCVDPLNDPDNCGACGTVCPPGRECAEGSCVCPVGMTECRMDFLSGSRYGPSRTATVLKGWDTFCTDTQHDTDNCGACGNACGSEQICVGGQCMCPENLQSCDDACVDIGFDPDNCGYCNQPCRDPLNPDCCYGRCTNILTDEDNCGQCKMPGMAGCAEGFTCCNGACKKLNTDYRNCGECGHVCGAELVCCDGECTRLQSKDTSCGTCGITCDPETEQCCDGVCTRIVDNENNCGQCGKTCEDDWKCCKGQCKDILNDWANCGSCDMFCGVAIFGTHCIQGHCCFILTGPALCYS